MATKTMSMKVLHVCKTTEQWAAETTVISKGLLCIEFTTDGKTLAKVGDGVNPYSTLKYISDGSFVITDYYTKTEVDDAIDAGIESLGKVLRIKGIKATVEELPTEENEVGDIWFVGVAGETADSYEEYVWTTESKWEYMGRVQTDLDLSEYAKIEYVDEQIKAVKDRLDVIEPKAHTHTNADVLDATTASFTTDLETKLGGIEEGANKTVVDTELSADSTNPVENKAVSGALDTKVDKEEGKGLSTNDYTDEAVADVAAAKAATATLTETTDDLEERLAAVEGDYITSADEVTINCTL